MAGRAGREDDGGMTSPYATGYRVSDAEREQTVELLRSAYADGRLDHFELDLRLQQAMTATTAVDLHRAASGLYAPTHPMARPMTPQVVRGHAPTGEERLWAALAHGTGYVPILVFPALIMATAGRRSEYVRRHAAAALDLQLSMLLLTIVTFGLGGIVYAVAWILATVGAAIALTGTTFHYPWTLRVFDRDRSRP